MITHDYHTDLNLIKGITSFAQGFNPLLGQRGICFGFFRGGGGMRPGIQIKVSSARCDVT